MTEPQAQAPTPAATKSRPLAPIIAVVAAGLVILGSIGPWVTWGPFSVSGTEGDGRITLVLGLAAGVIAIVGIAQPDVRAGLNWLMLACFVVAAGIGAYDWADLESMVAARALGISVGWGLVLMTFAAVAGAISSLVAALGSTKSSTTPDATRTSQAEVSTEAGPANAPVERRDPFKRD